MKKENRELAQKRRAEERRKRERNAKLKKVALYGVPTIVILVLVIWVGIIMVQERKAAATDTEEAVTATETADTQEQSETETLVTDTSVAVEDGDTVNIDYVGTIDGVEFSGGNTQGQGTDLTIGSGTYIDDFEEQLIGHYVGETVEVDVTFPENYGNDDLNGKDAVFQVTINGIYQ